MLLEKEVCHIPFLLEFGINMCFQLRFYFPRLFVIIGNKEPQKDLCLF